MFFSRLKLSHAQTEGQTRLVLDAGAGKMGFSVSRSGAGAESRHAASVAVTVPHGRAHDAAHSQMRPLVWRNKRNSSEVM